MEQYAQQTKTQVIHEARDALQIQRTSFERAAQEFEQQARDVTEAEVAQAQARVQSQALSTIQRNENHAEQALAQQRAGLVDEARQAISDTRRQVVGEAETAFVQQQSAFGQQYHDLYRIAEGDVMQERRLNEYHQAELQAYVQREQSLSTGVAELARLQEMLMQEIINTRHQAATSNTARKERCYQQ